MTRGCVRVPAQQGVKKPYNPIIGETFACAWRHEDGSNSQYIAEQVSHRPPVSAMYFENRQANLVINAQVWTKSKFKAPQTAVSILAGGADVHVLNHNEVVRRAVGLRAAVPGCPLTSQRGGQVRILYILCRRLSHLPASAPLSFLVPSTG